MCVCCVCAFFFFLIFVYVYFFCFSCCIIFAVNFNLHLAQKFGIEPAVKRIGEFKSFGDSYSRDSMSAAQREVSTNLLETASGFRTGLLARSAGKSVAEVEALYDNDVSGKPGPVQSNPVPCNGLFFCYVYINI